MIPAPSWTPAEGFDLEPNALRAATEIQENVVVTAGPGAGKTEMLAQRADFLLRTGFCRYPRRILAISFKVDASQNLKERVRERCGPDLASRFDSHTFHGFARRVIDAYRPVLTGDDALESGYTIGPDRIVLRQITFDDMVPLAVQILKTSSIARNALRNTYSHVFLDEFQDCTNVQYQLIRTAFSDCDALITAVGDTKQTIMTWAGAVEGIFNDFASDFDAAPLNLYQNFRSAPRLRRMQNLMVAKMDPPAAVSPDTIAGAEGQVEVIQYRSSKDEAVDLAERVTGWIRGDGVPPSEIAILVSKQLQLYAAPLMAELTTRAVTFRDEHTFQDLLSEPAARFVFDCAALVLQDRQPDAYRRVVRTVVAGASDEEAAARLVSRFDRALEGERERVQALLAVDEAEVNKIVDRCIEIVGLDRLASLSPQYTASDRLVKSVEATRERLAALTTELGSATAALETFNLDNAVRILTVHKSKGLEFDTVVVLGVEDQMYWSDPDAERSAYFVAISRAKRRLLLTVCEERPRPDGFSGRWKARRTPHEEFLGYAADSH